MGISVIWKDTRKVKLDQSYLKCKKCYVTNTFRDIWKPRNRFFQYSEPAEIEENNKLSFLDVLIKKDIQTDKFEIEIYRKPTHTNI